MKKIIVFIIALLTLLFFANTSYVQAASSLSFKHIIIDNNGPSDMHSKTTGDFNNDGFVDLAVAGVGGAIYWYEYPSWTKRTITTSGGGWSTDMNTGDIDRDGYLDVIVSDYYTSDRIGWFENPGASGSWTFHVIGSPSAHNIEVADLDGDGDLDIVTRHQGSRGNKLEVWRQNSPDSWAHRTLTTVSGEGIDVGDLDKDGRPDIIIGGRWYKNPGDIITGAWNEYTFATNWSPSDTYVVMADINSDGLADVVMTPTEPQGGTYRTSWYQAPANPTASGWQEHIIDSPIETVTHSLQAADMNKDGYLDVVTAEMHQGTDPDEIRVYLNSDGVGGSWLKQVVDTGGSHNIQVADIGDDGDYDLFGTNWSDTTQVDLWENDLDPVLSLDNFTYIQVDDSRSTTYFGLGAGDLTGDGYNDIVSGKYFYRNPGNNMSGTWNRLTFTTAVDSLLTANIDDDAFGDVIAMDSLGDVYWLEATDIAGTSWNYTLVGNVGSADHGISTQGYVLGQLIAGGKPEIIITSPNGIYYFSIPANPQAGSWPRVQITSASYPEGVAIGDIDRDGYVDVAGTLDSINVVWWKNPANGAANWTRYNVGSLASAYADRFGIADFNGDSRADIVVSAANGSADGVYWFEAPVDPRGSGWIRRSVVLQNTTNSMDIADMDNDGDIDIISAEHRGTKKLAIWENNGSGNFVEHVVDTGKESHLGSRVFDLDRDGDLDIISIAWDSYQYLHLWRNDAVAGAPSTDTTPPDVSITSPTSGQTVSETITISATASDNVGVRGVEFKVDGQLIQDDTTSPYSISWGSATVPNGTHIIIATARDAAGNTNSASVTITVSNVYIPPSQDLLAAYAFNEGTGITISDSSGNLRNGTLTNGPTWTAGKYANALSFDGINDYVALGTGLDISSKPFTLSAWVSPTDYSDYRTILAKRDSWSSSDMRFNWTLNTGTGNVMLQNPATNLSFNYAPPVNTWTYLAVVANANSTDLYINGILQESLGAFTLGTDATSAVKIGSSQNGTEDNFKGKIDELRIYNRSLTQAEIQADMNNPIGVTTKGDVNKDNSVDSIDLQALVNHILGTQDYGSNADVNSDGSVDALDVQEVVNIILGV